MLQAFVQNVSSVLNICCKRFDLDVAYVSHIYVARASVLDVCCKRFDLDVAYVSHICCKSMFEMFQLFQSYVAISVLCCKLQVFYLDVA
jgi:hypothetical protein